MVARVKVQLNNCLDIIFSFQDDVSFSVSQAQKNVDRTLVQTKTIIDNLERLNKKFAGRIHTDESEKRIERMRKKRVSMFGQTLIGFSDEIVKLRLDIVQAMNKSQQHSIAVNDGFSALKDSHGIFGNLNTESQMEMYNLSKELYELSQEILKKLRKMKQRTDEMIALEASMVAVEVASLGAMAGGPFGAIVAAVTLAAATALTVAKELLQKDLQNLTDRYLQLMDDKKEKILELGNIDLDEETANFFMERLKLVSEGLVKTQQKDGNVFPLMQTIITKLQSFEHLLSGYKKVTENDIFRFFQNDINHCRDLNSEIQILSNQLKSVL